MHRASLVAAAICALTIASSSAQEATAPTSDTAGREEFDLEDIEGALEGIPQGELRRAPTAAERQASVDDRLRRITREHIRRCWRMPTEPGSDRLVVTVQFELNEDGTLRGRPRVIEPQVFRFDRPMRRAVDQALSAVRRCSPYPFPADPVAAEHYERWREMEFTFRPPAVSPAPR